MVLPTRLTHRFHRLHSFALLLVIVVLYGLSLSVSFSANVSPPLCLSLPPPSLPSLFYSVCLSSFCLSLSLIVSLSFQRRSGRTRDLLRHPRQAGLQLGLVRGPRGRGLGTLDALLLELVQQPARVVL